MRPAVFAICLLIAACTAEPSANDPRSGRGDEKAAAAAVPAGWEQRSDWLGAHRGGAAIRQEGYQFVLAREGEGSVVASASSAAAPSLDASNLADRALSTVRAIEAVNAQAGASPTAVPTLDPRQLGAWQRYCAGREHMSADDWTIVMNTSGQPFMELEARRHANCAALRNDFLPGGSSSSS